MKISLATYIAIQGASAFPSMLNSVLEKPDAVLKPRAASCISDLCNTKMDISDKQINYSPNALTANQKASASRSNCGARLSSTGGCNTFDAKSQLVSQEGVHAYADPTPGQIRGPCPGLNAASNHGYLPRSGVATIAQTVDGLGAMYGMHADLAAFLAAYAIIIDGDLISGTWSIGGPQQTTSGSLLGGLLGTGQGISYSHNKYEGDSSIGRCDAYINNGNAYSLSPMRFGYAYSTGLDNDRYTLDKFAREFTKNAMRSEAQNPHYFAPLFSTTLVSPAAYNFVINFMSNHSAQEPAGYLDGDSFKKFFSITGDYPNFKWVPGKERLPKNWYKRPTDALGNNDYQIVDVFGDLLPSFLAYPQSFRFGGNTNGVNTYVGVDIANFTNGVHNIDNLFNGNNLACFAYQEIQQVIPDFAQGVISKLNAALSLLTEHITPAFASLGCESVAKFNDNAIGEYPGRSYSPTASNTETCVA